VYIGDMALLDELACEKLEHAAKSVRKEGRKWVEVRPRFEYQEQAKFQQLHAEPPALSEELASEVRQLQDEYDRLIDTRKTRSSAFWSDRPPGEGKPAGMPCGK
jgi:ParB family transcriptional regulator, chromosome partitioning protein